MAYTPEDDAAILSFVSKQKKEVGGNRLWQEMQRQCVTGHSWQSMKYRYRVRLAKKQSEAGDEPITESETKAPEEENKVLNFIYLFSMLRFIFFSLFIYCLWHTFIQKFRL